MKVKELITKFGFEVDDAALEKLDKGIENIKFGVVGLGAALVGTVGTLFLLTKTSANAADRINDMAIASGIGAKDLQELGYAAQLSGSNIDSMANGLKFLNKNIAEAIQNPGGDAAQTFRKLGIQLKDSSGRVREAADVFRDLSGAWQKVPSQAQKTQIAMTLMGRAGTELIQTLNRGPKALRDFADELNAFGGAMDQGTLDKLGEFNDSLDRTYSVIGAIRNSVGAQLAPALTEIVDGFRDFLVVNREIIKEKITAVVEGLAWWLGVVWRVTRRVGEGFMWLVDKIGGVKYIVGGLMAVLTLLSGAAIVMGLITIAGLIKTIAIAAWAAVAPFALVAAKIIAIGAAVFLIVEDIVSYFQGKNSVTGVIVDGIVKGLTWAKDAFVEFMQWLGDKFKGWAESFSSWFMNLVKPFVDTLTWIGDKLGSFAKGGNAVSGNVFNGRMAGGVQPNSVVRGGNTSNNVQIGAPQVTVSVGQGADPVAVGDAVASGMNRSFADTFNFNAAARVLSPAMK